MCNGCTAAHSFATSSNDKILAELFKKDVESFAKVGLQLGKTIYGKNSSNYKELESLFNSLNEKYLII